MILRSSQTDSMSTTASIPTVTGAHAVPSTRRRFSHGVGFWVVSGAFLVSMAFSVVPSPLWTLYQQRDGFSTFAITIAFASYAVGVVISLFLAGHLSDRLGRKTILLPAIALEIVSALVFVLWPELGGLIVARVISGLGIGMLTATATAHILDLHLKARPGASAARGQVVSGAANLGGFGVGALVSGVLAQWVTGPLVVPYLVFIVLLALAGFAVALVPETVMRQENWSYRPQRIRVPAESRRRFLLVALTAFAAFSVLGLFTSLAPVFVAGSLGITSRFIAGLVVFISFAAAAVAQIVVRSLGSRTQVGLGAIMLIVGIVLLATAVVGGTSLPLFLLGGVVAGAGAGTLFKAALAVGGALAEPRYRGEVLAGVFLVAYLGLTVPVVGIGVATLWVSLPMALVGFAVVIVAVTVVAAAPLVSALRD